jgi:hypothetical protein
MLIGYDECRNSCDAHLATMGIALLDHRAVGVTGEKPGDDISVQTNRLGNVA